MKKFEKTQSFITLILSFGLAHSTLAQEAVAPASPDPVKGLMLNLPIIAALFGLFYFGLIRPQKNQQKKHSEFLQGLNKGDEVITASGIIGTIRGLNEKIVTLEVSQDTEIKVLRSQIQSQLKDFVST